MGLHLLYAHEVCVWHVPLLLLFVLFTAACTSSNLHGSIWRDEGDCDADEPGLEGLRLIMYPMAGIDSAIDRLQKHGVEGLLAMEGLWAQKRPSDAKKTEAHYLVARMEAARKNRGAWRCDTADFELSKKSACCHFGHGLQFTI
jgi:hypothetical protein